ncbi:FAD/NAD(P)-binding domain-containing protein [Macroventuria anomochaeta]|uniref:FAD/NAD(P)-binding domain-containing protein n=1 Tax=Macroventuria anomochaeta TaxID=301207 RepID=A0ACB6S5R2_9PLEO|nr:FAD/NAD(P)-binding domain-containing protein [Macroventuria anomochaeta]KAF2629601.1 FAD/NAD(P)-binding domain-containing protein [Macroventuria anomochaeta]
MSTETILILGGSYAGISAAHYALKHTIPQLPKENDVTYNVTLVNPSKDLYWRFAAPRALVSKQMMPYDQIFYPIEPAFTYAFPKFKFIQGTATHVDAAGQSVSVTTVEGEQMTVNYAALVIATGFTTPSPLFTQANDRASLEAVYDAFQQGLKTAKTVVIGGGGPVGVETAGEVAEILNGRPGFMGAGPKNPKAQVTLVCADKKLLPVLRESIGKTAEGFLKKLGCSVTYNTRVVSAIKTSKEEGAKTKVELSNGETIEADIYIDATGSRPNTSFLPKEWLDNRNRVSCNPKTLRVEHESAGPRVYALGDVGSYTRGGVMDLSLAVPVVMTNLKQDLLRHLSGTVFAGDRHYNPNLKEQQICPIGTQKGVGAFNGFKVPSQMVWMIKGRDYLISQLAQGTLRGDQWKKEGKWTPVQDFGKAGLSQG